MPGPLRLARCEVAAGGCDWIRKSRTLARLLTLIEPAHAQVRPEAAHPPFRPSQRSFDHRENSTALPVVPHRAVNDNERRVKPSVSDEYTVPVCRLHRRELHRYGDEASWWAAVKIDPLPIALELWKRSQRARTRRQSQRLKILPSRFARGPTANRNHETAAASLRTLSSTIPGADPRAQEPVTIGA